MLLNGGLLMGFGAGLCAGVWMIGLMVVLFMHHMFIVGFRWSSPGLYLFFSPPLLFAVCGFLIVRKAQRMEA